MSGDLPGATHDTAAARIWQILRALEDAGLIALGDKGYHGFDPTGEVVITPYKTWRILRNSAAAPAAPAASPKPSTSYHEAAAG